MGLSPDRGAAVSPREAEAMVGVGTKEEDVNKT